MGLLLNKVAALVTKDTEKAELTKVFLASVFTAKTGPQESQTLDIRECQEKGRLPHGQEWREVHKPTIIRTPVCNHSISQL